MKIYCTVALVASAVCALGQTSGDGQITILQTTDLHHHANGSDHVGLDVDPVHGTGTTGAYARIAAYVNDVRANTTHPVVLVDSGDWTMGTLYDLTLGSAPLGLQFLDSLKYDCVTLGNHEFDYAPQGLAQIFAAAGKAFGFHTPVVASNLNLGGSTDLAPYIGGGKLVQTTRVQDLANGLRVGYIGLMGKSAALDAPVTAPVTFTDFSSDYSTVQKLVDGLRNTQGVQVVIVLSHSGTDATGTTGEDVALARNVRGIDVIASGHTHTPLSGAHAVTNGAWTTQIIDAGAYGTNVARIDLTYHAASQATTVDGSSSPAMTDASLTTLHAGLKSDANVTALVAAADQQLNVALAAFLGQTFSDYDKTNLGKGIYHPVGTAAQTMVSNDLDAVPGPNGLGDLVADAMRSIPNGIVAQTLAAAGGNPANAPGYDFTPFQAGLVATGVLRGKLLTGVPLSFADIYNVLPLGTTPDTTQALPVGYPMVSAYLELADVKTVCALQLVAQSGLVLQDYYLNLSGLQYSLKPTESYVYFKYATAAGALQLLQQGAASGSSSAFTTLVGLLTLSQDQGAGLLAAYASDNAYAGALVRLNDANPTLDQIAANLAVVAQLATAAASDAANGTSTAEALVVGKAVAAIDTVSVFASGDATNTGTATALTGASRVRLATDLFAVLALAQVQVEFGVTVTAYKSATGTATLSGADLAGVLANRINATPASTSVQELKEWMALLSYLETGLKGTIPSAYSSSSDFTQFASAGAAVQTRNASYPLAAVAQLNVDLSNLAGAPACALSGKPVVAAVTNANYGATLSASGTVVVWGSGFSPAGGNMVRLSRVGAQDAVTLDGKEGTYFWNLSSNQINAMLPAGMAAGQWTLTVTNACGATSGGLGVTLQ